MKFKDEVTFKVRSGNGGPGCGSFRREIYVPRGGPDGGDGGRGGNVVFKVDTRLNTLIDLRPNKLYSAKNGQPGQSQNKTGNDGADLVLHVPEGTLISSHGEVLADLGVVDSVVLLEGGRGGKGNTFFKTSVNQAPTHFQPGEPGEEITVKVELKLIADVGLLGCPNAGKSTLISAVSAAKPKIADYPFTTLVPNLGVVKLDMGASFVIADIPGLIEGASEGTGLGIRFLKHVERTRLFLHILDSTDEALENYKKIRKELEKYDELHSPNDPLSQREEIIVLNKTDAVSDGVVEDLKLAFLQELNKKTVTVSAATRKGLKELIETVSKRVLKDE